MLDDYKTLRLKIMLEARFLIKIRRNRIEKMIKMKKCLAFVRFVLIFANKIIALWQQK